MSNPLTVGSQYRFEATLTKDGSPWDLTGATVTLYFKRPDGTTFSKTGSLLNSGLNGQVYYDCTTTDLDQAGNWTRAWKIVVGGVTDYATPVQFTVLAAP